MLITSASGLDESHLSYVLPATEHHALGVDWLHRGFEDVTGGLGLKSGFDRIAFAYGYRNGVQQLRPWVGNTSIGIAGKYVSQSADLDGQSVMSASGLGFDLGLLVPLAHNLRLGLAVQDVGGTSVEHDSGLNEKIFDANYRVGLAYKPPLEGLTLALDMDDHAPLRRRVLDRQPARAQSWSEDGAGHARESRGDATTATFGLGVKYRYAQLDYAYERHPVLDVTHYTSLSLSYNPRVVTIKDATVRPSPIFRSLYQHYQENDFFDVVIGNSAPEPIEATVGIMLPKVMSVPPPGKPSCCQPRARRNTPSRSPSTRTCSTSPKPITTTSSPRWSASATLVVAVTRPSTNSLSAFTSPARASSAGTSTAWRLRL